MSLSCLNINVYVRYMLYHVMSIHVQAFKGRQSWPVRSPSSIWYFKSGCPSKGYLRQPGDTSRTRLPRAFPSTHAARTFIYCSIFSNTISCLSNPSMSNAPFLLLEQSRVTTNPHSNIFSELGSRECVKAAECVPHVPTVKFWHALNYKTVEILV